jgi:ABC-type nickel/cobalt efflux system permease component RcnA
VTRAVSFGLITLLGLCVLWKHGRMLVSAPPPGSEASPEKTDRSGLVAWSLSVGLVPCPAVFMIVLFCMSMDAMLLGLVLAAGISFGMAATISLVVMAVVMGKAGGLRLASSKSSAAKIEAIIGVLSGGAIAIFGALFLMASIHAFQ